MEKPRKTMAGVMDVLHKFSYRGVKVVICRYLDTYNFFFALKGDVYLDYVELPPRKERRERKLKVGDFEAEAVQRLTNKALNTIDFWKDKWSLKEIIKRSVKNLKSKINETRKITTAGGPRGEERGIGEKDDGQAVGVQAGQERRGEA